MGKIGREGQKDNKHRDNILLALFVLIIKEYRINAVYFNKCMSNLSHSSDQNKPDFFPKTIAIYCNTIAIYLLYIVGR